MRCPKCDSRTKVIDTGTVDHRTIRNHRCLTCGYKFFTEEKVCDRYYGNGELYKIRHNKR